MKKILFLFFILAYASFAHCATELKNGLNTTGTVTANLFVGSGAGITGITSTVSSNVVTSNYYNSVSLLATSNLLIASINQLISFSSDRGTQPTPNGAVVTLNIDLSNGFSQKFTLGTSSVAYAVVFPTTVYPIGTRFQLIINGFVDGINTAVNFTWTNGLAGTVNARTLVGTAGNAKLKRVLEFTYDGSEWIGYF